MTTLKEFIYYLQPDKEWQKTIEGKTYLHLINTDYNVLFAKDIETLTTDFNNHYVSLDLEGHTTIYIDPQTNIFYIKGYTQNSTGALVLSYKHLTLLYATWEQLDDSNFVEKTNIVNLYYNSINSQKYYKQKEAIYLDVSNAFSYSPKDLEGLINDETYELEYKDAEGYTSNAGDVFLKSILDGILGVYLSMLQREVTLKYSNQIGLVYKYPKIKKGRFNKYILSYYFVPEKDNENKEAVVAISLEFRSLEAMLVFLNKTIFYKYKIDDAIEFTGGHAIKRDFFNQYETILNKAFEERKQSVKKLELVLYTPPMYLYFLESHILWSIIKEALKGSVTNVDINEEDAVLKILKTLSRLDTPDVFLNILMSEEINKESFFYLLYDKLNGSSFITFVELIFKIWGKSKYSKFKDTDTAFKTTNGPKTLAYTSKKTLGFFYSNCDIDYNTKQNILDVSIKTGKYTYSKYRNELVEIVNSFIYHPFYPIRIPDLENVKGDIVFKSIVPAFYLKANEDKTFWSNVITTGEYALDVVTTLSGVGNIVKFRYLAKVASKAGKLKLTKAARYAKVGSKIKQATAAIEITSGTVNALLKLSGLNDTKFGKELSAFLFWIELLSLGGELTVAIKAGLRKNAKALLKQEQALKKELDDLVIEENNVKRKLTEAEVDEVFEHLDVMSKENTILSKPGGKGFLDGQRLGRKEIKQWLNKIDEISNGKASLNIIEENSNVLSKSHQAGFNPFKIEIVLKRGFTEYEIMHEFKHLEEFMKLGDKAYIEGMSIAGGSPYQNIIRTYKRELYVYNELMKVSYKWNKKELKHAKKYIDATIKDCLDAGIDITKI